MRNRLRKSILATALMAVAAAGLLLAWTRDSSILPRRAGWEWDHRDTTILINWLKAPPGVKEELRNVRVSRTGDLCCRIRVPRGARGTVIVAVGEGHWLEPGRRLMDIFIDDRLCRNRIDPVGLAGQPHRPVQVVCQAEDLDRDGFLRVQVKASSHSPDPTSLASAIWWLPDRELSPDETARLMQRWEPMDAGLFIPAVSDAEVWAHHEQKVRRHKTDQAVWEAQSKAHLEEDLARLARHVRTEDPALNALVEEIYADCVLSKRFDPYPPALPYSWFSPGGRFMGQWLWDTMFVLTAYAPLDDDAIVREVFENFWYCIDHNPMAPPGSYRYGILPNFLLDWPPVGYSQIPLLAWGCERVFLQTNDRQLIERALPYLIAFDRWYSRERDVDGDGLVEYGAYQPVRRANLLQTARYETFDRHPALDKMKLTRHPRRTSGGEWYGNVEGVEQTCFLALSEQSIARLARRLGRADLAARYEAIAARRLKAIRERMWEPQTRFFYSLDRDSGERIPVRTIQGFLTLTCGAATREQAAALIEQLTDPGQWWCAYPVPTVALDDPYYYPEGYWLGDMWPVTNYLVALGLNRYGYHREALQLTRKTLGLMAEQGINEHYNSATGRPLGVPGLGMSCSVWSMAVENLYGVGSDFRTVRVPLKAAGRRLKLGKLEVAYPEDDTVELWSAFERDFRVILPAVGPDQRILATCEGEPLAEDGLRRTSDGITFTAAANRRYRVSSIR